MNDSLQQRLKKYYQSSERYRDDLQTHDESFLHPYVLLIERYVSPNSIILDLGCGTGLSTRLLQQSGYQTIGVDLSSLFLKVEKEQNPGTDLISASAMQLPFSDQTFDAVTAFEFIEHIPNIPALLDEILRVIKPQGYIIFHSPNLISPYLPAFDIIRMLLGKEERPVFAETIGQAFFWLRTNISLSLKKRFSKQVDFIYREPDLSENRIGGDADSVYLANQMDIANYLKQKGCAIHQRAHAMSVKNKILVALTPNLAPYIGIVARKLPD